MNSVAVGSHDTPEKSSSTASRKYTPSKFVVEYVSARVGSLRRKLSPSVKIGLMPLASPPTPAGEFAGLTVGRPIGTTSEATTATLPIATAVLRLSGREFTSIIARNTTAVAANKNASLNSLRTKLGTSTSTSNGTPASAGDFATFARVSIAKAMTAIPTHSKYRMPVSTSAGTS